MIRNVVATALLLVVPVQGQDCEQVKTMIRETYWFKPTELSAPQKDEASEAMTSFWSYVKGKPDETLDCLREALRDEAANAWFLFDGSSLLVSVDPSRESKATQVRLWSAAPLEDLNLQYWLETLVERGNEDFDVSVAADRWLGYENASYRMVRHGGLKIGPFEGALFLFGSMQEAHATPALARIAGDDSHRGQSTAFRILSYQGTPDSWRALGKLDASKLSRSNRRKIERLRTAPPKLPSEEIEERLTRQQIIRDLRIKLGDEEEVAQTRMMFRDSNWLLNAVNNLKPEDVDLLRRARRRRVRVSSDEAVYEYIVYSRAIQALTWSEEYFSE